MNGIDFLKFMGELRGLTDTSYRDKLIEQFELDTKGRIRRMSKGMKQKLGIICAFMHDPKVLILDEPTSGLDPLMQKTFAELIHEEKAKGKTILISSHSFEEIERTCDRVGIIRSGELVVVLGPSGSGKSTLLNILGGMDTATSGRVFFQGTDISEYNEKQLTIFRRKNIGFIFQFYNLMPNLTAKENVELATEISDNPMNIDSVLEKVGLKDRMDHFP
jgi:ABC-type multidrug transport system ATPase subunit